MKGKETHALMTPKEAREAGLAFEDPEMPTCQWCGKKLEPLGVAGKDGHIFWISRTECDCEGTKAEKAEDERRLAEQAERELRDSYLRSGIKRRFLDAEVNSNTLASYLNGYADEPSVGLYIAGPSRAGKTYCASALGKAFVASGYRVVLTTSLAMLDSIKASFDGDARSGMVRFTSCDLLIIDDLGKENANAWVMTTLFQVINERYEAMKPTIVTSQYSPDELTRRMSRSGERESAIAIVERLRETCKLVALPKRKNVHLMDNVVREA